ncbi:MAG: M48 family peptidase, partial [Bacteroidales bacterium]|nr:M48 family peptidase [Bacteroidales bacterium]
MRNLILLSLLYLVSCSSVPMTGRKQFVAIPSSQIIALSSESYTQVLEDNELSGNTYYLNTVKRVGENLTRAVETYLKQNGMEAYVEGYDWQYNVLV